MQSPTSPRQAVELVKGWVHETLERTESQDFEFIPFGTKQAALRLR